MPMIRIKCPAKTTSALDEHSESLEMCRPALDAGSQIKIKCPAKINLTLEVLNKRSDGFHNIQSIMQTIDLYDILTISIKESSKFEINLSGTSDEIPYDERNLVYKAADLFFQKINLSANQPINLSTNIHIEKNIPVAAGLAGGSTDAAGTIYGLNKIFDRFFSGEELHELCAKLGSDLNFCLEGGCHLTSSRGEILKKIPFCEFPVSLIKPKNLGISAKEAYTKFSELKIKPNLNNTEKMLEILKTHECDIKKIEKLLHNDLEIAVINDYEELQTIKKAYPNSIMSGSGSTFFALEQNIPIKLNNNFWVKTNLKSINHGVTKVI